MKSTHLCSGLLLFFTVFMVQAMTLKSADVKNGDSLNPAQIFNLWGCSGTNLSPQLTWSDPPKGTKSFAVTMYDPDAPTGSGWWHWVMINIPANVNSLKEGAGNVSGQNLPTGSSMVTNDFGFKGFGGACPPENAKPHHYTITVYALDVPTITIPFRASPAFAGYKILAHAIDKAVLIAPTRRRK